MCCFQTLRLSWEIMLGQKAVHMQLQTRSFFNMATRRTSCTHIKYISLICFWMVFGWVTSCKGCFYTKHPCTYKLLPEPFAAIFAGKVAKVTRQQYTSLRFEFEASIHHVSKPDPFQIRIDTVTSKSYIPTARLTLEFWGHGHSKFKLKSFGHLRNRLNYIWKKRWYHCIWSQSLI